MHQADHVDFTWSTWGRHQGPIGHLVLNLFSAVDSSLVKMSMKKRFSELSNLLVLKLDKGRKGNQRPPIGQKLTNCFNYEDDNPSQQNLVQFEKVSGYIKTKN